jgi:acetyl-CoA acetyltransferase
MKTLRRVRVAGVGMTKFEKPGQFDYPELTKEAGEQALRDAGVPYDSIEQAYAGYVYGDSTCGQRAIYQLGLTGIPVYNVNNNCSTGSSALHLAYQAVGSGLVECALAMGFEKMERGSLGAKFMDRTNPMDKHAQVMIDLQGFEKAPPAAQMFGGAGREMMQKYGITKEQLAKVAVKNRKHGSKNERSQFRDASTLEEVLAAPMVFDPLTKFQCCPTSDGAAAAILCSEDFAKQHGLEGRPWIAGMAMATDMPSTFDAHSMIKMVGQDLTKAAAKKVYEQSGLGPDDVQVIELHDCFTPNELVTYEGLGLCGEGESGRMIDENRTTYGGKWVVNPSGGLLAKGHPLGATGLAQCFELNQQLRGLCGDRQVEGAHAGLQHNLGLGGACVVTLYRRD